MAPAMTLPRPSSFEVSADEAPSRSTSRVDPRSLSLLAVRLPFVAAPAGADEAGFLQVAHQWTRGGGSLYGRYWVDRPPLLITLYQLADLAGGVGRSAPARLRGRRDHGAAERPGRGAAGRASRRVDGRPSSRPRCWSRHCWAVQRSTGNCCRHPSSPVAYSSSSRRRGPAIADEPMLLAGAGGAAGLCAMMVKQNIADVFVFGAVFLAAGAGGAPVPGVRVLLGGAPRVRPRPSVVISAWTLAHGTSLVGVFDAMYPFRLRAARVLAAGGSQYASERATHIATGLGWPPGWRLLTVCLVASTARRGWRDPALLGLAAVATYDAASVALGGGYWLHYLVELVVPLAVWTGVLAARRDGRCAGLRSRRGRVLRDRSWPLGGCLRPPRRPSRSVSAIARVKQPGDTLTTLYGDAPVNLAAGVALALRAPVEPAGQDPRPPAAGARHGPERSQMRRPGSW